MNAVEYSNNQWNWSTKNLTYTLENEDVGSVIGVKFKYYDSRGNLEQVTSDQTSVITNINNAPEGYILLTGSQIEDQTLTVDLKNLIDKDGLPLPGTKTVRTGLGRDELKLNLPELIVFLI